MKKTILGFSLTLVLALPLSRKTKNPTGSKTPEKSCRRF